MRSISGQEPLRLRAAEETAVASRYDREVVALTTVVTAANAYFQVLAAQDRLRVARENLASATRVLNLIQQRLQAGTASALEPPSRKAWSTPTRGDSAARANLAPKPGRARGADGALAESVTIRGGSLRSIAYPRVTPGLPSELLAQRPDIREAEANLAAANANVENARAQFLPEHHPHRHGRLPELGSQTFVSARSAIYIAAASLTQPIFQGGGLIGNLDLQKGKQDELLQTYRKAVIRFADVENALNASGKPPKLSVLSARW